jgi:putative ABC transport system permease protein
MDLIFSDIRMAARRLIRQPTFAITAILTLAVGIGANSAVFTLVNGVLLQPLPYRDAGELVYPHAVLRGSPVMVSSSPVFLALREQAEAFTDVAIFSTGSATLAGADEPEQVSGGFISSNYFDVLGVPPLLGRAFRPEENEPGNEMVVLLSEGVWRERFGADASIIGRIVEISGDGREVVGVMPARASFPTEWRFWVPQTYSPGFRDPTNVLALGYNLVARLKPGVTVEQASADVARVVELAKIAGELDNPRYTGAVIPLQEYYVGEARRPLLILLGAVVLVLLVVCANLANLLLAQAASRSSDFAVRASLGASSGRLLQQLLTESVVLGLVGGAAGLLLGMWAAEAMVVMLPPGMPRMPGIALDYTVVGFTLGISLLAAFIFGLVPAVHARRTALASRLREGGRGFVGRFGGRTRSGLVLAETALGFALVIGAGLLIRSLGELSRVNPGFNPENTLAFEISLPPVRYDDDEKLAEFWERLMTRIEAVPGVRRAGAIQHLPLGGSGMRITFEVEGREPFLPGEEVPLDVRLVTPGFFEAMSIGVVRGRTFTGADRAGSVPVALLSESAVAQHFPNEDPIGRRIIMGWTRDDAPVEGEVVGVVGDVRHHELRRAAVPEIYFPVAQVTAASMAVTVRTATAPTALMQSLTHAVHQLDPGLAVANMRPLTAVVATSVATERFITRLLTAFSAIALLLAAIGIFGVISYSVTQRRREIGLRMAVGASGRDILVLVVRGSLRLAAAGIVIGVVGALALGRLMSTLLFGVQPFDAVTFLAGGAILMAVAFTASVLPALSAARTAPATVLNTD